MTHSDDTNQLLREIRDLLAEQSEIAKTQIATSEDRVSRIRQAGVDRVGELHRIANRNAVIMGLINGGLVVAAIVILKLFFPTH